MNDKDIQELWIKYKNSKDNNFKSMLVDSYIYLVKSIASRLCLTFKNYIEYDDLVGYGQIGLLDAIEKYNINMSVKFETYASRRIHGQIIDEVRNLSWVPRGAVSKKEMVDTAREEYISANPEAKPDEINKYIMNKLGIPIRALKNWDEPIKIMTSLESQLEYDNGESEYKYEIRSNDISPEEYAIREELKKEIKSNLDRLTVNEKKVVILYYYEELTLKEISRILEISESRVSQIRKRALEKLKKHLVHYMDY